MVAAVLRDIWSGHSVSVDLFLREDLPGGTCLSRNLQFRTLQPGRSSFGGHCLHGPEEGVRRCPRADGGVQHTRSELLLHRAVLLDAFHQIRLHHLPLVGDGIVEGKNMQGRLLYRISHSDRAKIRRAPSWTVRRRQERLLKTFQVEVESLTELVHVQLVDELLRIILVVVDGKIAEDIVRGYLESLQYGYLLHPADMIVRRVAGDYAVVGRDHIIQRLDAAVLESGHQGRGLEHRSGLRTESDRHVVSFVQ